MTLHIALHFRPSHNALSPHHQHVANTYTRLAHVEQPAPRDRHH